VAQGGCYFNNVAVAAVAALEAGAERVMILDWDVHHGHGTQARVGVVGCVGVGRGRGGAGGRGVVGLMYTSHVPKCIIIIIIITRKKDMSCHGGRYFVGFRYNVQEEPA
jgi:hypothetical protein